MIIIYYMLFLEKNKEEY